MKQTIRHRFLLALLLFTAVFSVIPARVFALAGTVYFTPSGGNVVNGNEFIVEVRGNVPSPGIWGGGATIKFTYDASKVQLIDRNDTGGVFQNNNRSNWDGTTAGTVRYEAVVWWGAPGVNNQKIISVKFKAIAPGNVTLNFAPETNVNNGPTTGTPSTFTVLPTTCPTGQIGTPPNCTTPPPPSPTPTPKPTPKPSTTPTPKPSTTPTTPAPEQSVEETPAPVVESDGGLKIEDVKIVANRQKNSVTWTINKADAVPKVTYGTTKGDLRSEATVTKQEDGSYETVFPSLKLGTLYYFTIKATTPDQLQGATYNGTLTTRGYPVQLTIQQNGVLAPGAKVKIGDRSFTANKNAIITTELGDRKYDAMISPIGSTDSLSVSFTVQKKPIPTNGSPELQSFILNASLADTAATQGGNLIPIIIGGASVLGIGAASMIGFILLRRRNQSQTSTTVDNDLLLANYGTAIEEYRTNTPTPNLDATATNTAPVETTPLVATPPPVTNDMPAPVQSSPAPDTAANFDASTLPLPPVQEQPQMVAPPPETPENSQITEQLSPELAAVESIEENPADTVTDNPDETSAVYDAATGELDIIHHHTQPTNQAPPAPAPPPPSLPQPPLGASQ
jgi:hypothetical protein